MGLEALMPEAGFPSTVYSDLVLPEVGRAGTILHFTVPVLAGAPGSWPCQLCYCLSYSPPTQLGASPLHRLGSGSELQAWGPATIQAPALAPSHWRSLTLPLIFGVAAEHPCAICKSITVHLPRNASSICLYCDSIKTLSALPVSSWLTPRRRSLRSSCHFCSTSLRLGFLWHARAQTVSLNPSYQL